ncbi:MAG: type II/IV secretion system ATPase subunit [Halobacteriaceae archaeon]
MYEDIDDEKDREAVFTDNAAAVIAEHAATVSDGSVQKLFYYVMRDFLGFGKVDPLMHDPAIEDISCDGTAVPVFVYHHLYRDLRTNISFDRQTLNSLVVRLAQRAGRHISVSDPLVDATLSDGSRIQLTLGTEVSTRGSNFTIRKFADEPYTPVELIQWETFSIPEMAYFWLAIENGKSLMFAGGTGSGKTTSMNVVSFFIPPDAKVVSIEDTREITLPHDNWIQSVTRRSATGGDRGDITTYELLQAALRQRPEYLLVGEIRTEQRVALTFFQAIGTGHTAYTTFHADSVDSLLHRLQNPPLSVPAQMLLDLDIVSVQRQTYREDQRVRRNDIVAELTEHPTQENTLDWTAVFEYDGETDTQVTVGDSLVLEDIADRRGWSEADLADQIDRRERVSAYLVENDITQHAPVAATIQMFARDPEYVLEQVDADTLDPTTFPETR